MHPTPPALPLLAAYYISFLALSTALIVGLARTLHLGLSDVLEDAFPGRTRFLRALGRLFDLAFCLMGVGYVAAACRNDDPLGTAGQLVLVVAEKLGWLVVILGLVQLFSLLLLARFHRCAVLAVK